MTHSDRPHGHAGHAGRSGHGGHAGHDRPAAPSASDLYRDAAVHAHPFGKGRPGVVITCSDRASAGEYVDRSGPVAVDLLRRWGFEVADARVVPDGDAVGRALAEAIDSGAAVVVTSGGTGVSARDLTPHVTEPLLDVQLPGIPEAVRALGVSRGVLTSVLSRGLAGIATGSVVVNLPGSVGAVRDGLDVLATVLPHLLAELGRGERPGSERV